MRCTRVRLLIDDHVDGLLPAADAEAVRDHLDACRDCRETAAAARAASTSLAVWGDLEPPAPCFDQILAKIHALPADVRERPARVSRLDLFRERARRWTVPSVAAAAAVVAGIAVVERTNRAAPRRVQFPATAHVAFTPAAARVPAWRDDHALRPGEIFVHPDRYDDGVRRIRTRGLEGDIAPVETMYFGTPR
jgi:anti-sigma factor RsiW